MAVYSGYDTSKVRNPQMKEVFDTILDITSGHDHDGSNTKLVVGGTVADGAVTNAKLDADVKVGSLAAITTTANTNVVAAVNELDAEIDDVSTLTTTATTIVTAINEVDADVGNVSTLTTTAKTVVTAINELKTKEAADVTTTGVQTLTNKTLTSPVLATALIDDGDKGCTVTSANQTNAAAVVTIPDIADAADTFVMKDTTQTLTLKTLTSPTLTTPLIDDTDKGCTITSANQTHAAPTVTIPDIIDAADTFCVLDTEQTLTLKTLTLPKIVTTGAIVDAGGDEYVVFTEATTPVTYIGITSGDTTVAPQVRGAGETNTDLLLAGTGTGNVYVADGDDITKDLTFELVGATTAKTMTIVSSHTDDRALTLPDATDTLVGLATTDALTNKTLTTPVIASIYQDAGKTQLMTLPNTASDTLVGLAATQTLTGKTLTTPLLTTPKINDGHQHVTITSANQTDSGATITIPDCVDSADTFVLVDTAQTLTVKTIDSASNTLKNVVLAYADSITRAEMITGKTLVAGVAGRTIKILSVKLGVVGAYDGGGGTSMVIQDTNGAPVAILTSLKAALTDGAKISTEGLAIANVTEGAGMTAALTADKGIAVAADAAWDAGTNVNMVIQYMYV